MASMGAAGTHIKGDSKWKTIMQTAAKAPPDLLSYPFPGYSAALRQVTRTYQPLSSSTPIYCLISVEKSGDYILK